MHLSQICALLFMSSILVEMYAMEVENMRLILLHRLMEEIGKQVYSSEHSNIKHRKWRLLKYTVSFIILFINHYSHTISPNAHIQSISKVYAAIKLTKNICSKPFKDICLFHIFLHISRHFWLF